MKLKTAGFTAAMAIFAALASTPAARAQDSDSPLQGRMEKLEDRMANWKQRMNLSPDQMEQVRPIIMQELKEAAPILLRYDPHDKRPRQKIKTARELKEVRDEADKKLKPILTGAQWETLKEIRKETKDDFKEERKEKQQ